MSDEFELLLQNCQLCPVECGANRLTGVGACGVSGISVAKYYLHAFEEPCISFRRGSGTVFFTGCNLRCPYCQNFQLSRVKRGKSLTLNELADVFKALEDAGAENVSLVTPSHLVPYLVRAFRLYRPKIPVIYNCGGYEKTDTLQYIQEYVDIWLPDVKFYSSALSARYLGRENYFDVASNAVRFMTQTPLRMTPEGKMLSGTIVRHLIMPLCTQDSKAIVRWFARECKEQAYLSLMSQYTPFGDIKNYPEFSRRITAREYNSVVDEACALGVEKLFVQERAAASEAYIPTWDF